MITQDLTRSVCDQGNFSGFPYPVTPVDGFIGYVALDRIVIYNIAVVGKEVNGHSTGIFNPEPVVPRLSTGAGSDTLWLIAL